MEQPIIDSDVVCFNCSVGVCENRCYEEAEQLAIDLKNLAENQLKRKVAYEKYWGWIDSLTRTNPITGKKPKGVRLRAHLKFFLRQLADTTYETEQKEYEAIGKFDNRWTMYLPAFTNKINTDFNCEDKNVFIRVAREFGAFDY
jgi:hypothetical protein